LRYAAQAIGRMFSFRMASSSRAPHVTASRGAILSMTTSSRHELGELFPRGRFAAPVAVKARSPGQRVFPARFVSGVAEKLTEISSLS
jgi:hypothetical protein